MEGLGLKYVFGRQLKGWLRTRQQPGKTKSWQRRYFILDSGSLSCLTRENDVVAIKTFILKDYELKESPKTLDGFQLTSGNGDSVAFRGATEEENKEWIKALRYTIYGDAGRGVFGLPLESLMKNEGKEGRRIPYIVEACVKYLQQNAMETEGIFRMPGRAGLIKELRRKFEAGERPSFDDIDVHTVASLFKGYLRDLPDSVVLPSFYQRAMNFALRFSDAASDEDRTKELTGLSKLLKELPEANYSTLAYLCRFLHELASNSEKTKMDANNLALVLGPNLIRHIDDNPELLMVTTDLIQHLVFMFIQHFETVFPSIPNFETVSADQNSVATGDLLQLSEPKNSPTSTSKSVHPPSALDDLKDVSFNSPQNEMFGSDPSPTSSTGSFVMVSSDLGSPLQAASNKEKGSVSKEVSGGTGSLDVGSTSTAGSGARPVPPKRTKFRTLKRNSNPVNTAKTDSFGQPDTVFSDDTENVYEVIEPVNLQSRKGFLKGESQTTTYNDEDDIYGVVWAADSGCKTGSAGHGHQKTTVNDKNQMKRDCSVPYTSSTFATEHKNEEVSSGVNFQCQTSGSVVSDYESVTFGTDTVKLGTSQASLEAQVTALKSELINAKSHHDSLVSTLESQIKDVHSGFERKISSMEKQHAGKIKDLKARLAAESKARATAVEQTVDMQAQLYRYQLQFGELDNSL